VADDPIRLSDAEWTVMNAVWERSPASARDVVERVGPDSQWAYTTVKTLLQRLVDKGALSVRMRANQGLYEPLVTREKARRSALRSLLDKAFDGTFGSLLTHMVTEERLSAKDKARLQAMLDELGPEGGRS
jgi:BlaI family penicillinase repressor